MIDFGYHWNDDGEIVGRVLTVTDEEYRVLVRALQTERQRAVDGNAYGGLRERKDALAYQRAITDMLDFMDEPRTNEDGDGGFAY